MTLDVCDEQLRWKQRGSPVPAETARRLKYVFEGERVTLVEDEQAAGVGTVTVHPGATPKTIDVMMADGPGAWPGCPGTYEDTGDRLRLCIGPQRPAGFEGVGSAMLVGLERAPA